MSKSLKRIIISSASLIVFVTLIVWLWQRQPTKTEEGVLSEKKTDQETAQTEKAFAPKPETNSVLPSQKQKITGKILPESYIAIAGSGIAAVAKTDKNGNFEKELNLEKGLNLVDLMVISTDLTKTQVFPITYFVTGDSVGKTVYTGAVKTIFDTLITITTTTEDRTIRTSKSTVFDIPKDEDEATASSDVKNIRLADYVIALGDTSEKDSLIAKKIFVLRDNKPQNSKEAKVIKIVSAVAKNAFSARDDQDKVITYTITKDTKITAGETTIKPDQILKDKSAIVISTTDKDKTTANLIYLIL